MNFFLSTGCKSQIIKINDDSELVAMQLANGLLCSCWLWKYVILEST